MVWGCICYNGVGSLVVIDKTMDSISYVRTLSTNLFASANINGLGSDFIFQQDNAPCHKSKFTMEFFEENNINLLDWPPQSPDLNPIENVWAYISSKLEKKVIKKKHELVDEIIRIWNEIPSYYIKKLYDSIPKRLEAVLRNRGGHIPY